MILGVIVLLIPYQLIIVVYKVISRLLYRGLVGPLRELRLLIILRPISILLLIAII